MKIGYLMLIQPGLLMSEYVLANDTERSQSCESCHQLDSVMAVTADPATSPGARAEISTRNAVTFMKHGMAG